ncbi:hypothetical protein MUK42_30094 [Musa troglodytarum]|uniref:Uncharacterized protein n=1 Tax=Musa troglodytarum TaxID=320322 RepID=A0A9E7FED6_9LILI|nr:hypothetical protein MUK42_30094 [Musa troglodytarum]
MQHLQQGLACTCSHHYVNELQHICNLGYNFKNRQRLNLRHSKQVCCSCRRLQLGIWDSDGSDVCMAWRITISISGINGVLVWLRLPATPVATFAGTAALVLPSFASLFTVRDLCKLNDEVSSRSKRKPGDKRVQWERGLVAAVHTSARACQTALLSEILPPAAAASGNFSFFLLSISNTNLS